MYEYKIIRNTGIEGLEKEVNSLSKTGWRLVQILETKNSKASLFTHTLVVVMEKQKVQVFE